MQFNNIIFNYIFYYIISEKQLRTWIESQRTRYGKLTAAKSGQGAVKLTERDTWICSSWSFLDSSVVGGTHRKEANETAAP